MKTHMRTHDAVTRLSTCILVNINAKDPAGYVYSTYIHIIITRMHIC